MRRLMMADWWKLVRDEHGSVASAEILLITTILGLGAISGLTTFRDQVTMELADAATAFARINQSYSLGAISGVGFSFAGSTFTDTLDFCQNNPPDTPGMGTSCVGIIEATPE